MRRFARHVPGTPRPPHRPDSQWRMPPNWGCATDDQPRDRQVGMQGPAVDLVATTARPPGLLFIPMAKIRACPSANSRAVRRPQVRSLRPAQRYVLNGTLPRHSDCGNANACNGVHLDARTPSTVCRITAWPAEWRTFGTVHMFEGALPNDSYSQSVRRPARAVHRGRSSRAAEPQNRGVVQWLAI